jgi:putative ABC transport system ATP-binding protein
MSFLQIEQINKVYDQSRTVKVQALKDVDLAVEKGDFVVISGPSGSGKTTLLNLIGGLDSATSGHIHIDDHQITGLKERELSKVRLMHIGFIFQAYNLIPVLTAMENIEYIMMLQGVPEKERRDKARSVSAHLGIEDLLNKRPNEMSGGQQQRVAVARSIVSEPDLVLADEPTANLDSKTGEKLIELMRGLNEEKKITFIFSTHDKMVMEKARRRIVLRDGQITSDESNGKK